MEGVGGGSGYWGDIRGLLGVCGGLWLGGGGVVEGCGGG